MIAHSPGISRAKIRPQRLFARHLSVPYHKKRNFDNMHQCTVGQIRSRPEHIYQIPLPVEAYRPLSFLSNSSETLTRSGLSRANASAEGTSLKSPITMILLQPSSCTESATCLNLSAAFSLFHAVFPPPYLEGRCTTMNAISSPSSLFRILARRMSRVAMPWTWQAFEDNNSRFSRFHSSATSIPLLSGES